MFKKKKKTILILGAILFIASVYLCGMIFFSSHFFPQTYINGIDVSGMNADKANEALNELAPELVIIQKSASNNDPYVQNISLRQMSSDIAYDTSADLSDQNVPLWFINLFNRKDLKANKLSGTFNNDKINELIDDLYCLQEENISKPVNAHYEFQDGNIVLIKADDGTYIDKNRAIDAIRQRMDSLFNDHASMELDLRDLYDKANISDDDPSLASKKALLEKIIDKKIEFDVYDGKIEMDKEDLCSLLDLDDSDPSVNEERLDDYVLRFAIDNDGSSSYIDKADLKEKLNDAIISSEDELIVVNIIAGQPVRKVEVILNEQTLYYYEDDVLTLKAPVVTGNKAINDGTPTGNYEVRRKVTDTNLRGRDYIEHVDYWVGFDETGGIYGLHDAQWRDEFGGDIWTYDPSRGCVNMPLDKIGLLFQRLRLGDEISIYE